MKKTAEDDRPEKTEHPPNREHTLQSETKSCTVTLCTDSSDSGSDSHRLEVK